MSMETQERYYVLGVECANCRWKTSDLPHGEPFTIPCGTPIKDAECPQCGCRALGPGFMGRVTAGRVVS